MTTSDLWRSWPHRPTSRTVHLLNQHLRAASLWHSNIGHKLSTSLHWLQLQVGCLVSPLSLPYSTWAHLTPLCWTKCFWESICRYDVDCRHENPLCITTSPMSRRHIHHGIPTPTHVLSLDLASVNHAGVT